MNKKIDFFEKGEGRVVRTKLQHTSLMMKKQSRKLSTFFKRFLKAVNIKYFYKCKFVFSSKEKSYLSKYKPYNKCVF